MTMSVSIKIRSGSLRGGLTLIEMIISIPLVGIALAAALNTVGASRIAQFKVSIGREAHLLAQDLMTEILLQDYEEPVDTPEFGQEAMEEDGDRAEYDDVDDYDDWSSSPPEYKDGMEISNLDDWERSVAVVWADPSDISQVVGSDQGVKRITVTARHNDVPVAELVALKTIGLPPLEACCFDDCEDLRAEVCAARGGTAQGPGSNCAGTVCRTGPAVLFVVTDDANPTAQELARQALIESWDFHVPLISDHASQAEFAAAAAEVDACYISVAIAANELGTKLSTVSIGVVNANPLLLDDLGFSSGAAFYVRLSVADVVDNTHFITSTFATGTLTLSTSDQWFVQVTSGLASGAEVLATIDNGKSSLFVFVSGAQLVGGTPAPGRRVQLLWGDPSFDLNALTEDAQTIMKRAIEWAAGMEKVCGDGKCDVGEECDCAADCGAPAAFEQPGVTCDDGMDNDCDGATDCADINCSADLACSCGNGTCDPAEDCNTCSNDCPSRTFGKPSGQYCCGNGIAELAEGKGSICDGNY